MRINALVSQCLKTLKQNRLDKKRQADIERIYMNQLMDNVEIVFTRYFKELEPIVDAECEE